MAVYRLGWHCPKCGRRIHNPRRTPPKCCGRVMVNDYDPSLIIKTPPAPPALDETGLYDSRELAEMKAKLNLRFVEMDGAVPVYEMVNA